MQIRQAKISDAELLLQIYNSSNKIFGDVPDQNILETFENIIQDEQAYILEKTNRPLGFAS